MSELDTQRIFERLESLEKQNHNIKVACSLAILLSLIVLLSWAMLEGVQKVSAKETDDVNKKDFIQSEGFVLIDSDGNRRAKLVMEAGIPCLTFLSADGNVAGRLAVGVRAEYVRSWPEEKRLRLEPSNGLYLYDAAGAPRISVCPHNGFSMYGEKGQLESRMSSDCVRVYDEEKVASMSSTGIGFSDRNWNIRASLNSNNGLRLYDSDGKETASLQPRNGLRLYDSKGSSSVSLQPWIGLRLHGTGRSGLRLLSISSYDDAKRCCFSLNGNDGLTFFDAQGKPKINSNPAQTIDLKRKN